MIRPSASVMNAAAVFALATTVLFAAESPVVGRIGEIEITTSELKESLAGVEAASQDPLALDAAALNQYARALLLQRFVLKQASEEKWDQDPAVIAKLVRARETALAESWLAAKSTPPPDFPSAEELSSAYEANKDQLTIPKSYLLAQIYIKLPDKPDDKTKAAAKARLDTVSKLLAAKDADFAAIARAHSDEAASSADGGRIGWLTETQILPEIRTKLPKLSLGAISEPILLQDGWHIVKVLDVREARTPALAEIRDDFVTRLRAARAQTLRTELITRMLKENSVAINEIELSKLLDKP